MVFKNFLPVLVSVAFCLSVLALMIGGVVLMVNPKAGKQLLKNVVVATLLFFLGAALLEWCRKAFG